MAAWTFIRPSNPGGPSKISSLAFPGEPPLLPRFTHVRARTHYPHLHPRPGGERRPRRSRPGPPRAPMGGRRFLLRQDPRLGNRARYRHSPLPLRISRPVSADRHRRFSLRVPRPPRPGSRSAARHIVEAARAAACRADQARGPLSLGLSFRIRSGAIGDQARPRRRRILVLGDAPIPPPRRISRRPHPRPHPHRPHPRRQAGLHDRSRRVARLRAHPRSPANAVAARPIRPPHQRLETRDWTLISQFSRLIYYIKLWEFRFR